MSEQGHASDAQLQERLRDIQRRRKREHDDDVRTLMGAEWGRRLVYWLSFELGRLNAPSFEPAIKDGVAMAQMTARNEGIREMASEILREARETAPEQYLAMMVEQVNARQADLAMSVESAKGQAEQ